MPGYEQKKGEDYLSSPSLNITFPGVGLVSFHSQLMPQKVATFGSKIATYDQNHIRSIVLRDSAAQPHFESPQFRQVMQPSIMTTAAVLHFRHSCAPCG